MSQPLTFAEFLPQFFELFAKKSFKGADFPTYLGRPAAQRAGDEASVVDNAVTNPLLGLLGFEAGERVYNQQHHGDRPDFAPSEASFGTCFMVEDKSTSIPLTFDLADPDSHLSQLSRYVRSQALRLGWLTNGGRFTVWRFDNPEQPMRVIDLDIPAAIAEWAGSDPPAVSEATEKALVDLFDLCRKDSFTDGPRLERELARDFEDWAAAGARPRRRQQQRAGSGRGAAVSGQRPAVGGPPDTPGASDPLRRISAQGGAFPRQAGRRSRAAVSGGAARSGASGGR